MRKVVLKTLRVVLVFLGPPQNERKMAFSSWDLFQISLNMHSLSPLNNCRSGSQSLQHISTLLILASEL